MAARDFFRRLRGAVGNALVWGGAWFIGALALAATLRITGLAAISLDGALRGAAMFAVMGTIAGGAFSTFIRLWYHGRRLEGLSWVRFGIAGAVVTGLFVPSFIIVMRFLSGDPFLPLEALLKNGIVGAVLGGAAAGATLKLAQLAKQLPPGQHDQPEALEGER
jgi:hypothetical protein